MQEFDHKGGRGMEMGGWMAIFIYFIFKCYLMACNFVVENNIGNYCLCMDVNHWSKTDIPVKNTNLFISF